LARRSFALHAGLAEEIAENWSYRRLDTYGGFAGFRRRRSAVVELVPLALYDELAAVHQVGTDEGVA
jgi:hypothetical protein